MFSFLRKKFGLKRKNSEKGFSLLEYCAGAAVMICIVYGAVYALGGNMRDLMNSIGSWVTKTSTYVGNQDPTNPTK